MLLPIFWILTAPYPHICLTSTCISAPPHRTALTSSPIVIASYRIVSLPISPAHPLRKAITYVPMLPLDASDSHTQSREQKEFILSHHFIMECIAHKIQAVLSQLSTTFLCMPTGDPCKNFHDLNSARAFLLHDRWSSTSTPSFLPPAGLAAPLHLTSIVVLYGFYHTNSQLHLSLA
jgi:hypothetical protein